MTAQSQAMIAYDHVQRLTNGVPMLRAEHSPLFAPFVDEGKLEPNTSVTSRRQFISPLAGGLVRSVVVNRFTSFGQKALYEANDFRFCPYGRIDVYINKEPLDISRKPTGPWVRSAFQYSISAPKTKGWTECFANSDEDIGNEFGEIATDELENWGVKAKIIGQQAAGQSIEFIPLPDYEYCVNYQLSELE